MESPYASTRPAEIEPAAKKVHMISEKILPPEDAPEREDAPETEGVPAAEAVEPSPETEKNGEENQDDL